MGSSGHFWTANKQEKYSGEEFFQAANLIDRATSRVKARSGKSANATQRGTLKASAVYHFQILLGDEDGRETQ